MLLFFARYAQTFCRLGLTESCRKVWPAHQDGGAVTEDHDIQCHSLPMHSRAVATMLWPQCIGQYAPPETPTMPSQWHRHTHARQYSQQSPISMAAISDRHCHRTADALARPTRRLRRLLRGPRLLYPVSLFASACPASVTKRM
jgi:hypothetical protein